MSGIVNSIGNLFGGSAAKTDRKQQLAGFGDLSSVFNFALPTAKSAAGQGNDLLGQAGSYFSKLLSGNRASTLSAVAPTVNTATAQTDATKRQIAGSGTARGGGVNATTQTLEDQKRSTIDNAVNQAKAGAAAGATGVGSTLASEATSMLGLGANAAADLTKLSGDSRATSDALHRQKVKDSADFANQIADLVFG